MTVAPPPPTPKPPRQPSLRRLEREMREMKQEMFEMKELMLQLCQHSGLEPAPSAKPRPPDRDEEGGDSDGSGPDPTPPEPLLKHAAPEARFFDQESSHAELDESKVLELLEPALRAESAAHGAVEACRAIAAALYCDPCPNNLTAFTAAGPHLAYTHTPAGWEARPVEEVLGRMGKGVFEKLLASSWGIQFDLVVNELFCNPVYEKGLYLSGLLDKNRERLAAREPSQK